MARKFCDFCGCAEHEVDRLVAGPQVMICTVCVELCAEMLADGPVGRWKREQGAAEYESWARK